MPTVEGITFINRTVKTKNGNKTVIYYRLPSFPRGKKVSTHTSDEKMAYSIAQQAYREDLEASRIVKGIDLSLKEFIDKNSFYIWEDGKEPECRHCRELRDNDKQIAIRHAQSTRRIMENHLFKTPFIDKQITEITTGEVKTWKSGLAATSPRTANRALGALKLIYRYAKEDGVIEDDYHIKSIPLSNESKKKKKRGTFSTKQLQQLFRKGEIAPWERLVDKAMFHFAFTTGMRRSEILALKWEQLDLDNKTVKVTQAFKDDKCKEIDKPKWNRTRATSLTSDTIELLEELADSYGYQPKKDDFVFCIKPRQNISPKSWNDIFHQGMKNAKIDAKANNLTPHSFRATLNSQLMAKGYDSMYIRATLGWSEEEVQELYYQVQPEQLKKQTETIEDILDFKEEPVEENVEEPAYSEKMANIKEQILKESYIERLQKYKYDDEALMIAYELLELKVNSVDNQRDMKYYYGKVLPILRIANQNPNDLEAVKLAVKTALEF